MAKGTQPVKTQVMPGARISFHPHYPPSLSVALGWKGWPRPRGLHEFCAGLCVVHQDLELRAHVEVAPVDCDPGAPSLGALVRLQELDQGQLWGGRGIGFRPFPRRVPGGVGRKVDVASLTT